MLEDIIAVPFDHGPVELLSPAAGNSKPARARRAQRSHRRWPYEVTLQVPVRPQFLQGIGHLERTYNRMITVRSAPGFVAPTIVISRLSRAQIGRASCRER